jgi:hypothetical protein
MSEFIKPRNEQVAAGLTEQEVLAEKLKKDEEELTLRQALDEFTPLRAFAYLPSTYLDSYKLKRYEAKRLADQLTYRTIRTSSAVPMLCTGPACSVRHICTLKETRDAATGMLFPISCPCPVESSFIEFWRTDYYRTLRIDVTNKVERDRVEELLEIDLTMWRISGVVASKGYTVESAVGTTSSGTPLFKTELNPLLEAKDRAAKRKDKILDELIATREAKERSSLRKSKVQLAQGQKDWFQTLSDKAALAGIEVVRSPIEIGADQAKAIEYTPNG